MAQFFYLLSCCMAIMVVSIVMLYFLFIVGQELCINDG